VALALSGPSSLSTQTSSSVPSSFLIFFKTFFLALGCGAVATSAAAGLDSLVEGADLAVMSAEIGN
jgi:hypothetical protein